MRLWLGCLECHPIHQNVVGSISGRCMYGRQPIDVSLSLPSSISKINKHILR